MAQFYPLTVTNVRKTIRDAIEVTFQAPDGADFSFIPGQYMTFRRDFDGTEIRRNYSVCSGIDEGTLRIGIKRVDGGSFSTWANTELKKGDVIEAMPPMGKFHTPISPDNAKHYIGFAGGSGITPILSILRSVLAREPNSRFTLVYANRAVNTIMFREEIEDLKNQHLGRFSVIHVLETDAQDIELFTGRVDAEKCAALFKAWINPGDIDLAFICGPEPMMLAIRDSLQQHGLTNDQIKIELFAGAQQGRATRPAASADTGPAEAQASVTLDGATRHFPIRRDQSVLEAALDNALDAPFACRAGVCSTCRCKVIEGEVEMMANHALEDYEVRAGFILSCQSYPTSERIVVDYDAH